MLFFLEIVFIDNVKVIVMLWQGLALLVHSALWGCVLSSHHGARDVVESVSCYFGDGGFYLARYTDLTF